MIPYGKHYIDENDIQAVVDVLRGEFLTQGPAIAEFENAFSKYVGAKYAVAVSSCTAGLHLAAKAAGMGPGDTLITSPITFVSSANAGLYAGGNVAFADIDPTTINMDPATLAASLESNPTTKVVVPVHFAGLPCEMDAIKSICDRAGAVVVEDAAHALGATYKNGQRVGSCCYSLMTVFSLHPVKAIAAGEGGVITTNDDATYRTLVRLRSHGINKLDDKFLCVDEANSITGANPWYYEMQDLGYHYRITDIQSALAKSQLSKLDKFLSRRREIATRYYEAIAEMKGLVPAQPRESLLHSAYHLFVVRIDSSVAKYDKAELMNKLRKSGILSQVHYIPVPMHPYYRRLGFDFTQYKIALAYYRECLSIPIYFSLSPSDQEYVIKCIRQAMASN
jgi:UDP-4-amino-4,6-dideoxy-N-acetyl-beta-L-altrosamine transaminase